MTDKPTIADILAAGRMEFETPSGWHAADLGLRNEVIAAAIKIPGERLHMSLLKGRSVQFRDDAVGLVVRWSPE